MSDSNQTNQTIPFTKGEMDRISHSLGINMYKAVMSHSKKDKTLPKEFYRNRYQAASDEYLDQLVENGFAETAMMSDLKFYRITEAGIKKFRSQFAETVNYQPKELRDLAYLKHRINWYCMWANYNFGGDNAEHILDEYENKFSKGFYVSHTTEDTINQFKSELKSYFKNGK